jgi:hypothetical protein
MRIRLTNYHISSRIRVLHYLRSMSQRKQLHTVAVDMETYSKLRDLGYTGESFNTVIKRLIMYAKTQELQKDFSENGRGAMV